MKVLFIAMLLAAAPLTPASLKAYRGTNGERVLLVRLAAPKEKDALIAISGTDSTLDGKTFLVEVSERSEQTDFATYEIQKGRYVLVTRRGAGFSLYVPGTTGRTVSLRYDEKLSDAADAGAIVRSYKPKE